MGEMFEISSSSTESLRSAGMTAYDHRIAPAFPNCWNCFVSKTTSAAVRMALASGVPEGKAEDALLAAAGGREVAKAEMAEFSATALQLMDCLTETIRSMAL